MRLKPKFRVGQVVRCYGIPEIGEAELFIGYRRIEAIKRQEGRWYYIFEGNSVRQTRLKSLTKRERG